LKPEIVIVTAEAAGIAAPVIVITKKEAPVELQVPARFATLLLPVVKVGVMDEAKNPEGYDNVIAPPMLRLTAAVNPNVTGTEVFPAIRSSDAIENDILETWLPILPDDTPMDGTVSTDVCIVTVLLPLVELPMVRPFTVMMQADAGKAASEVVTTNDEFPVGEQVPVSPTTLLLSDPMVGVTDCAKKNGGYEIVIVPPMGRDVVGVNPMVNGTMLFPATRSACVMLNETAVTCPKISPDATGYDCAVSAEV
jgi:hypothetical protein